MVTLIKGKIKDMLRIETACLEGFQMEEGGGGGGGEADPITATVEYVSSAHVQGTLGCN